MRAKFNVVREQRNEQRNAWFMCSDRSARSFGALMRRSRFFFGCFSLPCVRLHLAEHHAHRGIVSVV